MIDVLESEGVRFTDSGVSLMRSAPTSTIAYSEGSSSSSSMTPNELTNRLLDMVEIAIFENADEEFATSFAMLAVAISRLGPRSGSVCVRDGLAG